MLGFETSDDAAVWRLSDDMAALLTIDFFTPIVDDPYDFGRITAANALSDIYAMGGTPLTALNMLAFPCSLGADIVGEVVRGGAEKVTEAGAVVVGGHTIDDKEPKFGLSVFGVVHPDKVVRNKGARVGDVIVLTKPLGTGIWGTALKRGVVTESDAREVIESMAALNRVAAETMMEYDVHACTDVTGFGIAGHLHEMAESSGLACDLMLGDLPLFDRVWEFTDQNIVPGRTSDIIAWASDFASFEPSFDKETQPTWLRIVCDPQTSGGLMIALTLEDAKAYIVSMKQRDPEAVCAVIGSFTEGKAGSVRFV